MIFSAFPMTCVFLSKARKIIACFAQYIEKYAKIMHLKQFSEGNIPSGFRLKVQKINAWFVKSFFLKYAEIMNF